MLHLSHFWFLQHCHISWVYCTQDTANTAVLLYTLKWYLSSTPNIIANVRHYWLECAVRAIRKKLKLNFDGGDFWSNKCKRGYRGAYGGVWRSLRLAGVAMKISTHLIYFIKKCYKFCTFNSICEDNAAINCITFQNKRGSFPSTLTGHITLIIHKRQKLEAGKKLPSVKRLVETQYSPFLMSCFCNGYETSKGRATVNSNFVSTRWSGPAKILRLGNPSSLYPEPAFLVVGCVNSSGKSLPSLLTPQSDTLNPIIECLF
jgi:hypothetical protein